MKRHAPSLSAVRRFCLWVIGISGIVTTLSADQFIFIDQTLTWTKGNSVQPTQLGPSNWVTPVNYKDGTIYLRYEAITKPSAKQIAIQICMWQNGYGLESCSACNVSSTEGVYYWNLGKPSGWWQKNGTSLDWTKFFQQVTVVHRDGSCNGLLMQTSSCGTACYTGNDIDMHVPITFKATAIVVSAGSQLTPLVTWTGCPAGWGCGSTEVIEQRHTVSDNSVKAYLNPFQRSISIKTTGKAMSFTSVRILDFSGACVAIFRQNGRNDNFVAVSPAKIVPGAYIVRLIGNGFTRSIKLAISY